MARLSWPTILAHAKGIVESYDQRITLRQLFYRLVVDPAVKLPNSLNSYNRLGRLTAKARREGWFPRLADTGRSVARPFCFDHPAGARAWLLGDEGHAAGYRRDRQETQPRAIYLGLEKHTLEGLVQNWFRPLGLPVLALGGYSGEELVGDLAEELDAEERPRVLLYVGDFDPSGLYIAENYLERLAEYGHEFDDVVRVALDHTDVGALPQSIQPVKTLDPRYPRFVEDCDRWDVTPVQLEVEALPPTILRQRITNELENWWDEDAYQVALADEVADIAEIRQYWTTG